MSIFKKGKDKKKKKSSGVFERVEVGGESVTVNAFYMYNDKQQDKSFIEISAAQEIPQLHFSEVQLDVYLSDKHMAMTCAYDSAFEKAGFKVYRFVILTYHVYYI